MNPHSNSCDRCGREDADELIAMPDERLRGRVEFEHITVCTGCMTLEEQASVGSAGDRVSTDRDLWRIPAPTSVRTTDSGVRIITAVESVATDADGYDVGTTDSEKARSEREIAEDYAVRARRAGDAVERAWYRQQASAAMRLAMRFGHRARSRRARPARATRGARKTTLHRQASSRCGAPADRGDPDPDEPEPLRDRARALVVCVRQQGGRATWDALTAHFVDGQPSWYPEDVYAAASEAERAGVIDAITGSGVVLA